MARIAIDPITRIEGHLRIEAQVEGGKVVDAWSSSTMWRGIEIILKDRDPRDAWVFCQRFCGVCTTVHALASVRAVENALKHRDPRQCQDHAEHHRGHPVRPGPRDPLLPPARARLDRYRRAPSRPIPVKTAALAQSISDWPNSSATIFTAVQRRVKALVDWASSAPSPMPTGGTRPTNCRPR